MKKRESERLSTYRYASVYPQSRSDSRYRRPLNARYILWTLNTTENKRTQQETTPDVTDVVLQTHK